MVFHRLCPWGTCETNPTNLWNNPSSMSSKPPPSLFLSVTHSANQALLGSTRKSWCWHPFSHGPHDKVEVRSKFPPRLHFSAVAKVWMKQRDTIYVGERKTSIKKKKNSALDSDTYSKKPEEREQRCRCRMESAQNSNYPGMAICPDIFQCSPRTICLKIPNAAAVQHSADGKTSMQPFQANQPIVKPIALSPPPWRETGFGPTLHG